MSAPASLLAAATVAAIRSASFLAGMMTARSGDGMAAILVPGSNSAVARSFCQG
jgi:hypothetical protein